MQCKFHMTWEPSEGNQGTKKQLNLNSLYVIVCARFAEEREVVERCDSTKDIN